MIPAVPKFSLAAYLQAPKTDVQATPAEHYAGKLINLFYGTEADAGAVMPWKKTHDVIKFREKEVTLWTGYNGHGKSQISTQAALDFAFEGQKVVIGSFEMSPERTLYRMVRQAARSDCPSIGYIKGFLEWCKGRIWLLDRRGMVDPEYVIAATRYAQKELGAAHIFIDNLAKVIRNEDDMNGQKIFVDQCCSVANDTGMHVHIVHHLRKGLTEDTLPGKMDIKGSGAITDAVDNIFIVWRNKPKERAFEQKGYDAKLVQQPDCILRLCKQRNGTGREADIGLWYSARSMSYAENHQDQPRYYDISKDIALI